MHHPFILTVNEIHCIEDTDEFDSDEPYVLVFVADITRPPMPVVPTVGDIEDIIQNLVPTARTTRYGPWDDVDPGEHFFTLPIPIGADPEAVDAVQVPWRRPCWGIGGGAATVADADDLLVLVALMEHDNGEPAGVRTGLHAQTFAALTGYFSDYAADRMTRQELVARLRGDIDDALTGPITFGFIEGDDLAGAARELPLSNEDIRGAP